MDNNELLMIVLAFVVGYMCSGMMENMCGKKKVYFEPLSTLDKVAAGAEAGLLTLGAAGTFLGTQAAVVGTEVVGGGPLDPAADAAVVEEETTGGGATWKMMQEAGASWENVF